MRKEVYEQAVQATSVLLPEDLVECTDEKCDHQKCVKQADTGKWLVDLKKETYLDGVDDLQLALLAAQTKELTKIRKILAFFVGVVITSAIVGLIAAFVVLY